MRVAVTGGSGVVGSAVVRHLAAAGHEVRALSRSPRSGAALAAMGAVPVPGDLLDDGSLLDLVDGCDLVFSVAGVNEMCPVDPGRMWRVNVEGTRQTVLACKKARVGRLVHTSSAVTIGERKGEIGDESTTHRGSFLSHYERTKVESERVLFSGAGDLDVVSVNPSSVQGPGRASGTGKLLLAAARGRLPLLLDTVFSLVDVDDCARGHVLAATNGEPGQRYILSGVTLTMREAIEHLESVTGRLLPKRFIGTGPAMVAGAVVEALFRLARRQPPICREAVRVVAHGHRYDGSRAMRDLGLVYTPVEETLRRTLDWFATEGLLGGETP